MFLVVVNGMRVVDLNRNTDDYSIYKYDKDDELITYNPRHSDTNQMNDELNSINPSANDHIEESNSIVFVKINRTEIFEAAATPAYDEVAPITTISEENISNDPPFEKIFPGDPIVDRMSQIELLTTFTFNFDQMTSTLEADIEVATTATTFDQTDDDNNFSIE
ncbi:hypothetical protein HELRODRAFT_177851 [Helobdella robusta]|uniref:Uncharacterized protein n=1 Tax=Helobdella robusta TaxID=6412 RepID=T1FCD3_HELRO|nr:hypothetical protein HELRODRAFT_177851 [Helobdella robusta]ESN97788.1 hypothetical protein HELRODRAFT_177851 [Helobdella robusta]